MNHSNLMDFWQHIERYLGFKVFWGWKQADKWLMLSLRCLFVPWDRLVLLGIGHQSPHLWLCSSFLICLHELCKWFELKRVPLCHFHWIKRFATLHHFCVRWIRFNSCFHPICDSATARNSKISVVTLQLAACKLFLKRTWRWIRSSSPLLWVFAWYHFFCFLVPQSCRSLS